MRKTVIAGYIGLALLWQVAQPEPAAGQQADSSIPKIQPLSLPHLYWHFLIHLNVLDHKAAELTAQGKDGNWLRNDLQIKLQFSDADFASVRISSARLTSELTTLNQQAKSIQASAPSASRAAQMKSLFALREMYINSEIDYLTQSLSPEKRAALEAFMVQFFAPKTLTSQSPGSSSQPTGQAATQ